MPYEMTINVHMFGVLMKNIIMGRSEQNPKIPAPPRPTPPSRKTAPMVRATVLYLGPPHGAVRAAGGPFEKSRGSALHRPYPHELYI
jgi:hypothetical protein